MNRTLRPVDVARHIGMSTSALRHYESWGLLPPVPRSANGYRYYTDEHVYYLEALRALSQGYGVKFTSDVLRDILAGDSNAALWRMNYAISRLNHEKEIMENTIRLLHAVRDNTQDERAMQRKETWRIGDIEKETGVSASTIRYWEKSGITQYSRATNGYRIFSLEDVRQILVARTLRNANYSVETTKQLLEQLRRNDVDTAIEIATRSLSELNKRNQQQLRGIVNLFCLLDFLGLSDASNPPE